MQAYYLYALLADAGGRVFADVSEEQVTFAATIPGAIAYFQLRKRVAGWRAERRSGEAAVAQA